MAATTTETQTVSKRLWLSLAEQLAGSGVGNRKMQSEQFLVDVFTQWLRCCCSHFLNIFFVFVYFFLFCYSVSSSASAVRSSAADQACALGHSINNVWKSMCVCVYVCQKVCHTHSYKRIVAHVRSWHCNAPEILRVKFSTWICMRAISRLAGQPPSRSKPSSQRGSQPASLHVVMLEWLCDNHMRVGDEHIWLRVKFKASLCAKQWKKM